MSVSSNDELLEPPTTTTSVLLPPLCAPRPLPPRRAPRAPRVASSSKPTIAVIIGDAGIAATPAVETLHGDSRLAHQRLPPGAIVVAIGVIAWHLRRSSVLSEAEKLFVADLHRRGALFGALTYQVQHIGVLGRIPCDLAALRTLASIQQFGRGVPAIVEFCIRHGPLADWAAISMHHAVLLESGHIDILRCLPIGLRNNPNHLMRSRPSNPELRRFVIVGHQAVPAGCRIAVVAVPEAFFKS